MNQNLNLLLVQKAIEGDPQASKIFRDAWVAVHEQQKRERKYKLIAGVVAFCVGYAISATLVALFG